MGLLGRGPGGLSLAGLLAGVCSVLLLQAPVQAQAQDATGVRALLAPVQEAVLAGEIAARIDSMPLDAGERFRKGDVLVSFDCAAYRAALAEARAAQKAAEVTLENARELAKLNSGSILASALAEAELERAKARAEASRIPVERCVIRAPFGGLVVARKAQPHESVTAGQPLLAVLDDTNPEIRLVVPSAWLRWLKPNTPFTLLIDETGQKYQARLTRIGARVDPVSQTIEVFGGFPAKPKDLVTGMSGTASFEKMP